MQHPTGTPGTLFPRPALVFAGRPPRPLGQLPKQVDRVTPYLGSLSRWVETLKRPKRVLVVDVPIELDNGTIAHFEGYRVQHNLSRGPGRAVCFHQDVTLSEVMALSAWMSIKNAGQRALRRRQGRYPRGSQNASRWANSNA